MALRCTCSPLALRNAQQATPSGRMALTVPAALPGSSGLSRRTPVRHGRRSVAVQASLYGAEEPLRRAAEALVGSSGPSALDHLAAKLTVSMMTLADVAAATLPEGVTDAAASAGAAVQSATDAAADTITKKDNGWFGFLTGPLETVLKALDSGLSNIGVPYSYGFAIILLTVLVKGLTFPLSKKQVESTVAIQALQPKVKEIQEKYKGRDPKEAQVEIARLYQEAKVNPLAGCLPTLITLPVWIGLYRALSNVADEGLLTDGFFWIPSLAGPTSMAAQKAGGGSWLFPLQNGAPPIGWHDASAYLVLPVLLVVSQYVSQKVISPPSTDPSQQSTQWILKFLPLMIGWFSLNVPSGLTIYWFINNILSTAQQLWLKQNTAPPEIATATAGGSGRSQSSASSSSSSFSNGNVIDVDATAVEEKRLQSNPRGKKKGEKFRQLKEQEAAKKQTTAQKQSGGADVQSRAPTTTQSKADDPKVPDAPPSKNNSNGGA
ncbi:g7514 [Coccomyxa viridis]|uniref:G7514 protein n=1 Tax=Coccomyxa viridis TaxID=1274662 RepID=A0ABP1G0G3_9CHLO